MSAPSDEYPEIGDGRRRPGRLAVRLFGLALVVFSVFAATYLVVGYFAWESGRQLQAEQQQAQRAGQLARQVELARADAGQGSYALALRRVEWVLAQEPEHAEALALLQSLRAAQSATATPEAVLEVEAESTLTAVEDAASSPGDPLPELRRLRLLVARKQWEEALPAILAFQQQFPNDERRETDELLYKAYLNLGLAYVDSEKVELGLNYLAQAERLGNLPQEALDYRLWAELYLQGIAYFGVNWGIASDYFRDLCAAAPFYQSSCRRLNEALLNYGDQLAFAADWCPAELIYQEAWRAQPTGVLEEKLSQARENCLAATPTPITGTLPLTSSLPLTLTAPLTSTHDLGE